MELLILVTCGLCLQAGFLAGLWLSELKEDK